MTRDPLPPPPPPAFETEPGRQLQTDWSVQPTVVAGQPVQAHFAVSTLGYSRRFHFWATDCEDAEHTYEALVRTFEWFGGVPAEVVVDNQKTAVIEHRRGGDVRFHPRFVDLAGHYGFRREPVARLGRRPRARTHATSATSSTTSSSATESLRAGPI